MSRQPMVILTSDWHVRKNDQVWTRRPHIFGDAGYGILQVRQYAADMDIGGILLLGDNFDQSVQPSDSLLTMREAMDEFQAIGCQVYYIQGQHELADPPLLSAIHRWPRHFNGEMTTLRCGIEIFGLDYQHPLKVEDEYGDAWAHWVPDVNLIATGDWHKTTKLPPTSAKRRPAIACPGPLCLQKIDEDQHKHIQVLYSDLSVENVPLRARNVHLVEVRSENEFERLMDEWETNPARIPQDGVPDYIATNLVRIRYPDSIAGAKKQLEELTAHQVHLFLDPVRPIAEPQTADARRRVQAVMTDGLEGCLDEFYRDPPQTHEDARRLWRSDNIDDEVNAIFNEAINGYSGEEEDPPTSEILRR
jgi:hypothetical protein